MNQNRSYHSMHMFWDKNSRRDNIFIHRATSTKLLYHLKTHPIEKPSPVMRCCSLPLPSFTIPAMAWSLRNYIHSTMLCSTPLEATGGGEVAVHFLCCATDIYSPTPHRPKIFFLCLGSSNLLTLYCDLNHLFKMFVPPTPTFSSLKLKKNILTNIQVQIVVFYHFKHKVPFNARLGSISLIVSKKT